MAKGLERDLGLYAVFTISVGAMIGSGIFVLPGLAFEIAGPAVILAFVVAGLIVLPAALSKAEMATAMPESGGTYLYIDRAMGPLMGTVAGVGVWFSLVFKSAFALAGLGAYLTLIADVPGKTFALVIAAVLIGLNLYGAKITGRAQQVFVTSVLAVLAYFVVRGSFSIESGNLEPFFDKGLSGLITASAVVFVAYAGVTKIASVAEEVKNPGRNIPLGMLLSIGVMLLLYPAMVYVVVGTTPPELLAASTTPVADSATGFLGSLGVDVISVTAIVALTGMANAGILAASRYPFAMSRNSLAPQPLQHIGRRGTPTVAILATGGLLLLLIAFVPIIDLAKLASAFKLAVFTFINLALISFRQSKLDWYQPAFRSPLYPWVQIFGIVGCLVLLTQMGWVPLAGAVGITTFGVLWYRGFGKSRAIKDSALLDALRIRSTGRLVAMTQEAISTGGHAHVLIPVLRSTRRSRMEDLIRFGTMFAQPRAVVEIIEFEQDRSGRGRHPAGIDHRFEERTTELASRMGAEVFVRRIQSKDPEETLLEYVEDFGVDLVVSDLPRESRGTRRFIHEMKDVRDHLPCDSIFLRNRTVGHVRTVVIMGSGGPYDVLKISLAARIAAAEGSQLRFVHVLPEAARVQQADSIESYHHRLEELVTADTVSAVSRAPDLIDEIAEVAGDADLIVMGAPAHRVRLFGDLADRIADRLDAPVMMVHTNQQPRLAWYEKALERIIY
ncbi:MAG: universal stress protein [Acidimicrobiia bacterium]|nr:universal stress protein [Acidimicrobiia bacterium]